MNETHISPPVTSMPKKIPAWRRIGLKLARECLSQEEEASDIRKSEEIEIPRDNVIETDLKSSSAFSVQSTASKKRKFVRFSEDTKFEDEIYTQTSPEQFTFFESEEQSEFGVEEEIFSVQHQHFKPHNNRKQTYLEYLTQFYSDRPNWKFNKSAQISILKHVFDIHKIPESYEEALHKYLQGLQGSVARHRLAERTVQILSAGMGEYNDEEGEIRAEKARSQALKYRLFEEKVSMREDDDEHELETERFQRKAAKRKRAARIAAWMEELWTTRQVPDDLVFEGEKTEAPREPSGPINSVFSRIVSDFEKADGGSETVKRKRVTVRLKKARTGFIEDDVESISSVNSDYIAELLGDKEKLDKGSSSSSSSSVSSETDDEEDSESGDSEEDSEETDSLDEDNENSDESHEN